MEESWRAFTRLAAALRNTALGHLGFALVLIVAGAGWYLSYHNLHGYAVDAMGFTPSNAWLVPVVFDGAPLGLSIVVYRARLQARAAVLWRAGIWAFAALSAYVNWMHVPAAQNADLLAALLPIAAVVLFEGLMHETHKSAQLDLYGGRVVPRLTLACWILDHRRTFTAFRAKALRPLAAAEDTLAIPRAEPIPHRVVDVDLEAIGRAPDREHPPAHVPAGTRDHPDREHDVQGDVSTRTHPPAHGDVGTPHAPHAQTGRDQGEHTPVTTPREHGAHADVSTPDRSPRMAVFNPLDQGPAAAREQGEHTAATVAAAHRDHPRASHRELAEQLGLSRSTVRRYRPVDRVDGSP